MTGTASQIEWAELIRPRVEAEFHRVAEALQSIILKQTERDREETRAVIAILEEKCAETLGNEHAGYFIRNWQDITDQVRRMIIADTRYQAMRAVREMRLHRDPKRAGV